MKLRSCSTLHNINAIKGGVVIKTPNVNSRGKPGILFKNLKDIYEAECPRPYNEVNVSDCSDNSNEKLSEDDVSFGKMTLMQLKKMCKTKKRKLSYIVCKKEVADFQQEDDCDLTAPLSSWNITTSKNAKSKMKRPRRYTSAILVHDVSFKSGPIPVANSSQQLISANIAPMATNVEVSPVFCSELQIVSFASDTIDGSCSSDEQVNLFDKDSTKLLQTSDTTLETMETILVAGNYERIANTYSCSQLNDDFKPLSSLPPLSGKITELSTQESCQQLPASPVSEMHAEADLMLLPSGELCILEDNAKNISDMFSTPMSCLKMPRNLSDESEIIVSNAATDDGLCCIESGRGIMFSCYLPNGSTRLSSRYDSSPWNTYPCSASDCDMVAVESDSPTEDDWSLISNNSDTTEYFIEPNIHLSDLEDASYANEEKQLLLTVNTGAEISFLSNGVDELSTPEINDHHDIERWHPPEKFPSTRKAISPTSQEKLCLAMSSREFCDGNENYKCKGKLLFGNQTEDNALSVESDTTSVESCMTEEMSGEVTLTKAILGPKKILKKKKYIKKGSLPKKCSTHKGHFGRPNLTRSLPSHCTGRTSLEACQESAIAFSQRQMQDIESITAKLMTELKSMKDIVEEKLLYEAYRSTSMKNDADEVKSAIKSASRVEETTKKWLSMMARDCNRFCKIMSQPQRPTVHSSAATENILHKEKKKISFADEAGGVLCHVKYFEYGKDDTIVAS